MNFLLQVSNYKYQKFYGKSWGRMMAHYIHFKGVKWYFSHNVLLPDILPHQEITLSENEAKKLLSLSKAYFVRWCSDFDSKIEYPFWWVIKDDKEDTTLKSYSAKIRSEIRRGLRNCNVLLLPHEKVDDKFLNDLYNVYIKAFERYKKRYVEPVNWETYRKNIGKDILNQNKDFWVVYDKRSNTPIAYAQTIIKSNIVSYNVIKLHPDFLKLYPSYALFFEMNRYYLNEKNFLYVHDGTRSVGHETSIHEWLMKKFKFRKARCKLNIVYRKDVKLLVDALYPIRHIIKRCNHTVCVKLNVLVVHEEIRRKCIEVESKYKRNNA